MTITEFIGSIDTKLYDRIRHSKGDAECRRLLKEHEQKQLSIHVVSNRRELLIDFADLVMINDCDLHTKEERSLAVDKYLKGNL